MFLDSNNSRHEPECGCDATQHTGVKINFIIFFEFQLPAFFCDGPRGGGLIAGKDAAREHAKDGTIARRTGGPSNR